MRIEFKNENINEEHRERLQKIHEKFSVVFKELAESGKLHLPKQFYGTAEEDSESDGSLD